MNDPHEVSVPGSRAERKAFGRSLRARFPREDHAALDLDPARDPLPILATQDEGRVPALVPERYRRMSASPFAFLRGAAAVMACDLATSAATGIPVQACGDCHLLNFGAFSSPEGRVVFDINDFDETYPGVDFTVDLKRLAASVAVAGLAAGMRAEQAQALARGTVAAYRDRARELAAMAPLAAWQTRVDMGEEVERLGDANLRTRVLETLVEAERAHRPWSENPRIGRGTSGEPAFVDRPPFVYHVAADGTRVGEIVSERAIAEYKATLLPERAALLDRYRLVDAAFKVVGVGSVGTFCAVALMATPDAEYLVLQVKQAQRSVVEPLARRPNRGTHAGQRVVDGQRALQVAPDIFLGWTSDAQGRGFYVRQLKNRRLGSIAELIEGRALPAYAVLCGRTLARAHARTGDPAVTAGYIGKSDTFPKALARFAMAYAARTAADHAALCEGLGTQGVVG